MQRILIIIDLNFCVFWINIKRIIRCVDCPTIRQPKQGLTSFWFFHPHLSNDRKGRTGELKTLDKLLTKKQYLRR